MSNNLSIYYISYDWAGIDVVVATSAIEAAKKIISDGNNRECYQMTEEDINKLADCLVEQEISDGLLIVNYGDQ